MFRSFYSRQALRAITTIGLICSFSPMAFAQAVTIKIGPNKAPLQLVPRTFIGAFIYDFDLESLTGSLQASNPTCILTVPTSPGAAGGGYASNGGILLNGSQECAGHYELMLSAPQNDVGNGGVVSGAFAIVKLNTDTAVWAGTYTNVANGPGTILISSLGPVCGTPGTICANLPNQFGPNSPNGTWVNALIQLNGFTWNP